MLDQNFDASPRSHTKDSLLQPSLDIAHLEDVIKDSALLTQIAEINRSVALVRAYYYDQAAKAGRVAYYPGIGGGNEALDPLSAFSTLDVDEVIGVDLQTNPDPAKIRVDVGLAKIGKNGLYKIEILESDKYYARFIFDGRERKLTVVKGDAYTYIPSDHPPIIYQRRETGLIPQLPTRVIEEAKLIALADDNPFTPRQCASFGLQHGFSPVDLHALYEQADEGRDNISTYWNGTSQLLLRQDLSANPNAESGIPTSGE